MAAPLRFGILGTGNIAGQFARDSRTARHSVVTAVGSRTQEAADAFADTHDIASAHGTYDALLADPDVDAVYLTLPNTLHREWTIRALERGKHVLCEKPLAMTGADAEAMFAAAESNDRVLIEAYMYRAHPLTRAVCEAVRNGVIGELRFVRASFSYNTKHIEGNIRFDPALGGGALMDVGGYCLSYARLLAGIAQGKDTAIEPTRFHANGHMLSSHTKDQGDMVDDYTAGVLEFPNGVLATFTCGMAAQADNGLHLGGTDGYLDVPVPWKPPVSEAVYTLRTQTPPKMDLASYQQQGTAAPDSAGNDEPTFRIDSPAELYAMEADAFAAAVAGEAEPFVPKFDTLGNIRVQEAMRRQIGLAY